MYRELKIDDEKINKIKQKGYLSVEDDIRFNNIPEILRLFDINVKGWMKGYYILNENEGIMFTNESAKNWNDEHDDKYFYEIYNDDNDNKTTKIDRINTFWGKKSIYIFRKFKDGYKFLGVYKQDPKKIDLLFFRHIYNKRPYKKMSDKLKLI